MKSPTRRPWYRGYLPGWIVSGGGGGGGAATVQTDGVTIQGDGSAGNKIAIKAVQLAARLKGAGTVASPLDIQGWPLPGFIHGTSNSAHLAPAQNKLLLYGFPLPAALTFSTISFFNFGTDVVNNSDVGLYNSAGTLVANIGAQTFAASALQNLATVQGAQTINAGLYYLAATTAGVSFSIFGNSTSFGLYYNASFGASAGGALPASITAPALIGSINIPEFSLY